jgi:hypothetical protein
MEMKDPGVSTSSRIQQPGMNLLENRKGEERKKPQEKGLQFHFTQ